MLPRDLVARCARTFADKIAFIDGDRRVTWREMDERSNRLAAALQHLGIGRGDVVAILSPVHLETIDHWHACAKIGAVRTAINWRYASAEMLHIIRDCNARVIIVRDLCKGALSAEWDLLPAEGRILIGIGAAHGFEYDYDSLLADHAERPEWPPLAEDDLLCVGYTTGTTGLPKGALLSQRAVREALIHTATGAGLRPTDVWAQATSGIGVPTLSLLNSVNGMTTVLPEGSFDARRFLRHVEQHKVTAVLMVATMLRRVLEEVASGHWDTRSLRVLAYGSMPTPPALIRAAHAAFGCDLQHWYGATEGTLGLFTCLTADDHRRAFAHDAALLSSCGRPALHIDLMISDDEGRPVPQGEVGTVCVRGDVVMTGYLNRPDESADTLRDGWLRLHDLGRLDERGYLYLVDRKNFMIITGAFNVYPTVVEHVLAEHPAVNEVAVVGAAHPEWGEAVVAVVSLRPGTTATALQLIEFCRGRIATFEIPKHVEFLPKLPEGRTGKIDKKALVEFFRAHPERLPWNAARPLGHSDGSAKPNISV